MSSTFIHYTFNQGKSKPHRGSLQILKKAFHNPKANVMANKNLTSVETSIQPKVVPSKNANSSTPVLYLGVINLIQ